MYTTFLTGSCGSISQAITVDSAGNAIVGGWTTSPDFPVSANSYQSAFPGDVSRASPPAILSAGFVSKLSPAGDRLLASTFLGGGYTTQAASVLIDAAGEAYVAGFTQGIAPGATSGAFKTRLAKQCASRINIGPGPPDTGTGDAFVLKLDTGFSTARFLTYLGGSCNDSASRIALDPSGNIWISGITNSPDFPLKDPFQATGLFGARTPGFIAELNADASQLLFSSFSEGAVLALAQGSVYMAGASGASAIVAKIDPAKSPAIGINAVGPVITFATGTISPVPTVVAPGQWIRISGRNLGPATKVSAQLDATRRLPFTLGGTVVFFDNVPAALLSVEASTIECFVPFEVATTSFVSNITVLAGGQVSEPVKAGVTATAPQVLAILNSDGTLNSAERPAKVGSAVAIYMTGLGQTNPPGADGLVNAAPLPAPVVGITVFFSTPQFGLQVTPTFAGAAPGMIAGITQVNIPVPMSLAEMNSPLTLAEHGYRDALCDAINI